MRSTENGVTEFVLEQDEWQGELLKSGLSKANPHREMVQWYLENWRTSSVDEDLAHWGVPFAVYRGEYVKEFAEIIPLKAGDLVFDSATGSGWLIKSLLDEIQEQGRFDLSNKVRWFGNDIIPDALRLARRDIPLGQFVLSDSANLTWIPTESFDISICGYIEPSPDAIIASGFALEAYKARRRQTMEERMLSVLNGREKFVHNTHGGGKTNAEKRRLKNFSMVRNSSRIKGKLNQAKKKSRNKMNKEVKVLKRDLKKRRRT